MKASSEARKTVALTPTLRYICDVFTVPLSAREHIKRVSSLESQLSTASHLCHIYMDMQNYMVGPKGHFSYKNELQKWSHY